MNRDPYAAARNAVANASGRPVADGEIAAVLATGDGAGHVVRALFSDCAADSLLTLAFHLGLPSERLNAAYTTARVKHAAANETMDAVLESSSI